jgi:hypothetical protein
MITIETERSVIRTQPSGRTVIFGSFPGAGNRTQDGRI